MRVRPTWPYRLRERATLLLPILKNHDYSNHVGEADVLKLLSCQRRSATGLALHEDFAIHMRRASDIRSASRCGILTTHSGC